MACSPCRDTPGSQQLAPARPLTDHHDVSFYTQGGPQVDHGLVTTVINHMAVVLPIEATQVRSMWLQAEDWSSDPGSATNSLCDLGQIV